MRLKPKRLPRIKDLRNLMSEFWRPVIVYGGLFGFLGGLLFFKLGGLLPGYSPNEVANYQATASLRDILQNPLNAPFSLTKYGLDILSEHSYLLTRITAVIFGLLTLAAFCWLLNHWLGRFVAVTGTLLLGTSAMFLHIARFGGPEVLLFGLIAFVACGVWLKQTSNPLALLICFLLAGGLLYVPGMIWFVLAGVVWQIRTIDRVFKRHLWMATLGGFLLFAAMAPIAWSIYKSTTSWKTFVGLPAEGWPTISGTLSNLADIPLAIFATFRNATPERWLGHLPILDVLGMAMLVLGVFVCIKHFRLRRVSLLAAVFTLSVPLIAIGGGVNVAILLPFLYLLVAIGIDHLINRWVAVFPRNPIAKVIGISIVILLVATAANYQTRHYFVAWPHNKETKKVYTLKEQP